MNTMPKYVVSTTLRDPDWANTTVISGDVAGQIRELKAQPGQDIVQYGFGAVSTLLMEHDSTVLKNGMAILTYRRWSEALSESTAA
jgi:hypothetical protein